MLVNVEAQLGLGRYSPLGNAPVSLGSTNITTLDIEAEAAHSGSFHVLAMGRHFYEYVVDPYLPQLPRDANLPVAHPYVHLASKIRDSGVTGNIGEAIASIIACRYMGLGPADIAHVKPNTPFRQRRSPDYLMRVGGNPAWISRNWAVPGPMPTWWPVESKARSTAQSAKSSLREAYGQIVAYWHTIHQLCPTDIGFGAIICFSYDPPQQILISVLLPISQRSLLTVLQATDYDSLMQDPIRLTRRHVHGC